MTSSASPVATARRPPSWRRDKEFLPGALQILETPASPITGILTFTICALAIAALLWAYFGRIDVIAVAPGNFNRPAA